MQREWVFAGGVAFSGLVSILALRFMMESLMDPHTWALGVLIFLARVFDVTMGTMRTISIVHGRMWVAFGLGLMEVSMWLVVISAVITQIASKPLLGVFYALGFSVGNVVGILVERRVALGNMSLRVISAARGAELASRLRELGYGVTAFQGEGRSGAVTLLYVVCGRKDFRRALDTVKSVEPGAFYVTEMAGSVGKVMRPMMAPATGWRSVFKRK
jgi:uncharacterized protein YebE (UPF0316 family)